MTVYFYGRNSDSESFEKGSSIETQLSKCKSYANIKDLKIDVEITEKEKTQEELKEEKSLFDRKVEALVIAINNPEGQKLALKVKIYNNTCHIYQGIFSNVWGRINPNGSHTIYRHALTNMLRKNSATRDLF